MENDNETLLETESPELSFAEMADLVVQMQTQIEEMQNDFETRSFGKEQFQDKDVFITKGIVSVGNNDDVLIISGIDTVYRMWAGNRDPDLANFSVDKDGNINSVGGTITGALFRTAASGERIEIDTTNVNQIRFYNNTDLYGVIEVDEDAGSGYLKFGAVAGSSIEVGILMDIDVGASGYNSIDVLSNGGGFSSSGNASTGINNILAKGGGYFGVQTVATVDYIMTDLLPTGDPGVSGALYIDNVTGALMQSP